MRDLCSVRIEERARSMQGTVPLTVAHQLVAAVSTEPTTAEELWAGGERFCRGVVRLWRDCFGASVGPEPLGKAPGDKNEPAGPDIRIDLVRRRVACRSTALAGRLRSGQVPFSDGDRSTHITVRYHLPEGWRVDVEGESPSTVEPDGRSMESPQLPGNAREVLYGSPLLQYLIRQVERLWHQALRERGSDDDSRPLLTRLELEDALRSIHIGWLCRPLTELQGRSPREILLAKHEFLSQDMSDREDQWSQLDEPPPPLSPTCHAFLHGGFGTHEIVLYYELIRELLYEAWQQKVDGIRVAEGELDRLSKIRERWFDAPQMDLFDRTPREIIEQERRRLPILASPDELMIDCNCPMCRLLAESPGPTFWHLDESSMDEEFAVALNLWG